VPVKKPDRMVRLSIAAASVATLSSRQDLLGFFDGLAAGAGLAGGAAWATGIFGPGLG